LRLDVREKMEILWLAIVFYSLGLAAVLHFRPRLMFHENGSWKEFGYQRDSRHTMFPFWLFAIAWAFVSYAVAAAIAWSYGSAAAAAAVAYSYVEAPASAHEDSATDDDEYDAVPVSRSRSRRNRQKTDPRAGYYVLDPVSEESGLRRYIYYGSTPPQED
jgi:hypothetical protein